MKFSENNSIPLEDFFTAYYQCIKRKRRTINALEFEIDYEANLVKLWRDVNSRAYEIGKSICFIVTRPKIREIFAADFRDRIVHHVVMMRLEPLFEETFIVDNYNCRKGKGTLYGVKRLYEQIKECSNNYTEDCYISKFDMKSFFMSIHKPTLLELLSKYIIKKYNGKDKELLLWLVKKIIMNCPQYNCIRKSHIKMWERLSKSKSLFTCGDEYGLPIGNLTSQCFANFYLHKFDILVKNKFKYYGRYVDDFYVIAKQKKNILSFIDEMKTYLSKETKIILHPNKIYIQYYKKGIKFIGCVVKYNRIYISNSTVSNAKIIIHSFNKKISKETTEKFVQTLNSYFGLMKHYKTYSIRKKILSQIKPHWFKYLLFNMVKHNFEIKTKYKLYKIITYDFKHKNKFCENYYPI